MSESENETIAQKEKIGDGILGILTPEEIADYMTYDGIGMSFIKNTWEVDYYVPSATKDTIAAPDIIVMDHWEYDEFSEDYTITDAIQERMDEYEADLESKDEDLED